MRGVIPLKQRFSIKSIYLLHRLEQITGRNRRECVPDNLFHSPIQSHSLMLYDKFICARKKKR